ncbi:MAG: hypothetical protein ACI4MP_10860 [Candidatus Ventricola sp.]
MEAWQPVAASERGTDIPVSDAEYDNTKLSRTQHPLERMMNSGKKTGDGYVNKAK